MTTQSTNSSALNGKHAVVTGGGRGIGLSIARALAAHGASLTLMGRDVATLNDAARSLNAHAARCDVADPDSVTKAFANARARNGPIAILINNAGVAESAPMHRMTLEIWNRAIATNLTGTYLCCREVVGDMLAAKFGRIVNVSSIAGLKGAPYISAYCASKHGVIGLTRALAAELARAGITVNAVCPSYTDTDMAERAIGTITAKTTRTREQAVAELVKLNPQGRLVTPEEVANAVEWLCLPGSESITGQAIAIAGGEA